MAILQQHSIYPDPTARSQRTTTDKKVRTARVTLEGRVDLVQEGKSGSGSIIAIISICDGVEVLRKEPAWPRLSDDGTKQTALDVESGEVVRV